MSKAKTPEQTVVVRAAQAQAAAAKANAAHPTMLKMDRAKLQEALMWTEILGEPKCRKRHPRRSRLSDN